MTAPDLHELHGERSSERRAMMVHDIIAAIGATLGLAGGRELSPKRPAIVDTIAAVIIAAVATAVLLCFAAISPVIWTFASDTGSHLRSDVAQCLSLADGTSRLACYDEIARRPLPHPAKGANAPAAAFEHWR
jgi:hypothetical protein